MRTSFQLNGYYWQHYWVIQWFNALSTDYSPISHMNWMECIRSLSANRFNLINLNVNRLRTHLLWLRISFDRRISHNFQFKLQFCWGWHGKDHWNHLFMHNVSLIAVDVHSIYKCIDFGWWYSFFLRNPISLWVHTFQSVFLRKITWNSLKAMYEFKSAYLFDLC